MRLVTATEEELRQALAKGAEVWRLPGRSCDDDAAPPTVVLRRALESIAVHPGTEAWFSPRLFWVEEVAAIVGSGQFKTTPDHPEGVEIGYGVGARHQGKGYATTGVRLMLAEAFAHPNVMEIFATARADNLASRRVLEKCGFVPDGEGIDPREGPVLRFHLFRG
jgi:ribosomal-protein-alanine N-acetyltransferase